MRKNKKSQTRLIYLGLFLLVGILVFVSADINSLNNSSIIFANSSELIINLDNYFSGNNSYSIEFMGDVSGEINENIAKFSNINSDFEFTASSYGDDTRNLSFDVVLDLINQTEINNNINEINNSNITINEPINQTETEIINETSNITIIEGNNTINETIINETENLTLIENLTNKTSKFSAQDFELMQSYSNTSNSNLTIWDDSDTATVYANFTRFYANYTNFTGSSLNGSTYWCA
ncbi:hypothetical protein FJZ19_04095, partial [Candidatus Pacearchaeota archaeon]|nr:hypothetical protein [Candidatus Pacearchaeota archaeon]